MRCVSDNRVEEERDCESDGAKGSIYIFHFKKQRCGSASLFYQEKKAIHLDWGDDDCGTKYYLFLTTYSSYFDGVDDAVNLGSL